MTRRTFCLAGTGLAIAILGILVRSLADTAPDSDIALIDLAVLRVLSGEQWLGLTSRYGWSHPGPLYFQLLAPFYALTGHRHLANVIMAAAIGGGSLLAMVGILRRHSPAMLIGGTVLFCVYLVRMHGLLGSNWTPYVSLLPFALLIASAAATAAGNYRQIPLTVGAASFVLQTHTGFAPAAVAIITTASAIVALETVFARRSRPEFGPALARWLAVGLAVALMLWAVPLFDEVRPGGQHNLRLMVASLANAVPHDPELSARAFFHLLIAPFTPSLRLWDDTPLPAREAGVQLLAAVQICALLAAALLFTRRRQRFERNVALLSIAACGVGFLAVLRLPEPPLEYTLLWVTILGLVNWMVISAIPLGVFAKSLETLVTPGKRSQRLVATVTILIVAACALSVLQTRRADIVRSRLIQGLADRFREKVVQAHTHTAGVIFPQSRWNMAAGIVLQLRLAGLDPHVEDDWTVMFGEEARLTGDESVMLTFAQLDDHEADFRHRSNYERLGAIDDFHAYAIGPIPKNAVVPAPLGIRDHSPRVIDSSRLSDSRFGGAVGSQPATTQVIFSDDEDFATVDVPAPLAGIRLWGQPGSEWQLRCATDTSDFTRIGRITLSGDAGTGQAESFLWSLEGCRQLKVAPFKGNRMSWLSELQLLASSDRE